MIRHFVMAITGLATQPHELDGAYTPMMVAPAMRFYLCERGASMLDLLADDDESEQGEGIATSINQHR
jgi:hypothetical protein